jgi:hypothetical protein
MQFSSVETFSWKSGCALPAGNCSDLAHKLPGSRTARRQHVSENDGDAGKKPNARLIPTTKKISAVLSRLGVRAILTTGASIAERTPSTASVTRLSSVSADTLKQSSMLQRWTRQSLMVP